MLRAFGSGSSRWSWTETERPVTSVARASAPRTRAPARPRPSPCPLTPWRDPTSSRNTDDRTSPNRDPYLGEGEATPTACPHTPKSGADWPQRTFAIRRKGPIMPATYFTELPTWSNRRTLWAWLICFGSALGPRSSTPQSATPATPSWSAWSRCCRPSWRRERVIGDGRLQF